MLRSLERQVLLKAGRKFIVERPTAAGFGAVCAVPSISSRVTLENAVGFTIVPINRTGRKA